MTTAQPINSLQEFETAFFFALKDFHKTAIQRYQTYPHTLCTVKLKESNERFYLCSIHTGTPLASLHQNSTVIDEERVTVDKKVVASCLERVKSIVAKL